MQTTLHTASPRLPATRTPRQYGTTPPYLVRQSSHVDRALDGLAAFYATEADARLALGQAPPGSALLLGPAEAGWWVYRHHTAPWGRLAEPEGRPWYGDRWFMAAAAAVPAALGSALWMAFGETPSLAPTLAICLASVPAGGLLGAALASLAHRSAAHRNLDDLVRRQLAAGRWTVLYHHLSWEHQAAVLDGARLGSLGWSAVADGRRLA